MTEATTIRAWIWGEERKDQGGSQAWAFAWREEKKMIEATIIWAWGKERKKDRGGNQVQALVWRGKKKDKTCNKHNNFCSPLANSSVVFHTCITHKVGMNMDNGANTKHQTS